MPFRRSFKLASVNIPFLCTANIQLSKTPEKLFSVVDKSNGDCHLA